MENGQGEVELSKPAFSTNPMPNLQGENGRDLTRAKGGWEEEVELHKSAQYPGRKWEEPYY